MAARGAAFIENRGLDLAEKGSLWRGRIVVASRHEQSTNGGKDGLQSLGIGAIVNVIISKR